MAELHDWNSDEFLGFNLKLLGKKTKKNVLVSAGKLSDKERMFPALQKLAKLNVELFATPGTFRFLKQKGIDNQEIRKIADRREPNIRTFLDEKRLDLIINVLTGDNDYDEASDSKLIRSLAIEQGIPLITDVEVAIESIDQLVRRDVEGYYRYKTGDSKKPWDMRQEFLRLVHEAGGFANYHAHYDKAYLISPDNLRLSMSVFLNGTVRDAQKLLEEKARFRDLERAYAGTHLARLSENTVQSIETSSLHLDLISDLKRINSHICSIAYPILDSAGALSPTRFKQVLPEEPSLAVQRSGPHPGARTAP